MTRAHRSEALVVGAGPVGLFAALCLAERGVEVEVIDESPQIVRSFEPIALGPRALELLGARDLVPALEAAGRRAERIVVHDGDRAPMTFELATLGTAFPFLLITPRSVLRETLAEALGQSAVQIRWGRRLRALEHPEGSVLPRHAAIDELVAVSGGYAVAEVETVVKHQRESTATLVIGADGRESIVRRGLAFDFLATNEPETLAVYDFDEDAEADSTFEVVLHADGADVMWPLPGGGARWICSVPERDAANVRFESNLDLELEPLKPGQIDPDYFERTVVRRAPWLGRARTPASSRAVRYQRRRAAHFGRGLVWLGGDAAHLAGPLASQSENVGLDEASDLGRCGAEVLQHGAKAASFAAFDSRHRSELDVLGRRAPSAGGDERAGWLAASIPIFGEQRQRFFRALRAANA